MDIGMATMLTGILLFVVGILSLLSSTNVAKNAAKKEGLAKIARNRQEWINTLRVTMAEFRVAVDLSATAHTFKQEESEMMQEVAEGPNRPKILLYGNQLELMLNLDEAGHRFLRKQITSLAEAKEQDITDKFDPAYVAACQAILKQEWNRVKRELDGQTQMKLFPYPKDIFIDKENIFRSIAGDIEHWEALQNKEEYESIDHVDQEFWFLFYRNYKHLLSIESGKGQKT